MGSLGIGLAGDGATPGSGGGGGVTSVVNSDGYIGVTGTTTVTLSEGTALSTALGLLAPKASPTFTGTVTVPTTVNSTDAAQKAYVDGVAAGLAIKPSVQEATAAALPTNTYLLGVITITATGTLTVDGIAVALNDRVLVKNEAAQANNGIYVCTTFGTTGVAAVLTRSTDMNQASEIPGAFAFVEEGTVNAGSGWVVAGAGPYTIGTTAIVWTQFSGAGEITAGAGLTKTGNTLAVGGTITNTRITKRVLALSANSATPAINTDSYDVVHITAQTTAITSFTSGLTGTPVDGDTLRISITGTGAVALTWGTSFEASTVALPTTTVTTARLDTGFFWNTETSKWRCVAVA